MGLFINGDSAFNLGPGMMVPTNKEATTDFDFEQSSNRICIECAFGILVRRWGILWRPLEMKPKRRAPIIGACMRLHNFCIDKKIDCDLKEKFGLTEIQPNRWARTPKFDKDGRPVGYLDTSPRGNTPHGPSGSDVRDALIAAIQQKGLHRPHQNKRRKV
jgi:hypothetical protein